MKRVFNNSYFLSIFFIIFSFILIPSTVCRADILKITSISQEDSHLVISGENFGEYTGTPGYTYDPAADLSGDGRVNASDLAQIGMNWSPAPGSVEPGSPGDADGDGDVDGSDLSMVIMSWGSERGSAYVEMQGQELKIYDWTDTRIECRLPFIGPQEGEVIVFNDGGQGEGSVFTQAPPTAEEIAVAALLKFAGADVDFDDVSFLSDDQKLAIEESLFYLKNKKFIVFNAEVVQLKDYSSTEPVEKGRVEVAQDGDIYSLEVFQDGQSKGQVVIADVGELADLNLDENLYGLSLQDYLAQMSFIPEFLTDDQTDIFTVIDGQLFEPLSTHQISLLSTISLSEQSDDNETCVNSLADNIIPCNNKILFVDLMKEKVFKTFHWFTRDAALGDLKRLERLGYEVEKIKDESTGREGEVDLTILEELMESNAQIIYIYGHGSSKANTDYEIAKNPDMETGFVFPFTCIDDADNTKAKFKALIEDGGEYRHHFREEPQENIDYQLYKGFGCEGLAVAFNLKSLKFLDKAIDTGSRCHGGTNHLGNDDAENLHAIYLATPDNKNGQQANADLKLFSNYLLGLGPEEKHYTQYPPDLKEKTKIGNVNITNIGDYSLIPCVTGQETSEDYCSTLGLPLYQPRCERNIIVDPDTEEKITVQIPCTMIPKKIKSDVHLFPYVVSLDFLWDAAARKYYAEVEFSDDVKGVSGIDTNPSMLMGAGVFPYSVQAISDKKYRYYFPGEVSIVSENTWNGYFESDQRNIKTALFNPDAGAVSYGSTHGLIKSVANGISLVGNPLAKQTESFITEKGGWFSSDTYAEYWLYDHHFWEYNARAFGNDFNEFMAKVPYMLHPWVSDVTVQKELTADNHNEVTIIFSHDIATRDEVNAGDALDNSKIEVDLGQCMLPCSDAACSVYHEEGTPKYSATNKIKFRLQNAVAWEESSGISRGVILSLYDGDKETETVDEGYAVKITVKGGSDGIQSKPNHFPLLGNEKEDEDAHYWDFDQDQNGQVDYKENNSDKPYSQHAGDFEIWIPCRQIATVIEKGPDS